MLKINGLSKSYGKGKPRVINNISLTLTNGVYALLGPNGAGKTTFMNILTLGLAAESGEILWNNTPIEKLGKHYRAILGFMPQQQGLYDGFRGLDFLCYIASLKNISKNEVQTEVERVSNLVNLSDRLRDRLSSYSGGMKQRILLAAAVIGNPKLVILDEPTAGLDPKERIRVREIVKSMSNDKIILFATHVVSDIESIATEIIMLKKGVVIEKDSPAQLCKKLSVSDLEVAYMRIFGDNV